MIQQYHYCFTIDQWNIYFLRLVSFFLHVKPDLLILVPLLLPTSYVYPDPDRRDLKTLLSIAVVDINTAVWSFELRLLFPIFRAILIALLGLSQPKLLKQLAQTLPSP